jgi:D-lactate dehydrogenase
VQVVYLPSCVTRMMGPALSDPDRESVHEKLFSIFGKAGYEVILPEGVGSSCCGMMFNSRGFAPAAAKKMSELEASLLKASDGGKIPIVCDTSPCLMQIKTSLSSPALRFALYEPVEFVSHFLVDKLEWSQARAAPAACPCPCLL